MWLDRSLLWRKHINEICEKTTKYLNLFRVLAGSTWGVHPKHLRTLYISLIRSRLDFGSFLYDCSAKTHLYKLDKIQNEALRIIGGYIKSSPIHVMESELCLPPLALRRLYLSYKYCLKCMSISDNITIKLIKDFSSLTSTQLKYWQNKRKPLLAKVHEEIKEYNIYSSSPLDMFSLEIWTTYINVHEVIKNNLECIKIPINSYNPISLKSDVLRELHITYSEWTKFSTDGSKGTNG